MSRFEPDVGLYDPIICDGCLARHPKKIAAGREGWDWFTGHLTKTYHFCPKCKDKEQFKKIYEHSRLVR